MSSAPPGPAKAPPVLDARHETLSRRIAEAHEAAVPFVAILGPREVEARSVTLRARDGVQTSSALGQAISELARECASPFAEGR